MKPFGMNLLLAIVWLMLSAHPTIVDFLVGYGIGFTLILLFSNLIDAHSYVNRFFGLILFVPSFLWTFLKANFAVAKVILFIPKNQIQPTFIQYDVSDLKRNEVLILSQLVTLTPGTISVQLLNNQHSLLIHVLDAREPEEIYQSINKDLKEPFLRFMRS